MIEGRIRMGDVAARISKWRVSQVLKEEHWQPTLVEDRQKQLLETIKSLWRL
jgi:hypothetical protein